MDRLGLIFYCKKSDYDFDIILFEVQLCNNTMSRQSFGHIPYILY